MRKLKKKKNKKIKLVQKKKLKNAFFLGERWKIYLPKIGFSPKKKWTTVPPKKKELVFLNKKLKAKLSPLFFKPWIKNRRLRWTKRQRFLKKLYVRYQRRYSWKKRKDFLKTFFGEILKITHLHAELKKGIWFSKREILSYNIFRKSKKKNKKKYRLRKIPWYLVKPHGKQYESLRISLKKGWLYENLLRKSAKNAKHFLLERPHTSFQNHFTKQKKAPWIDALLFQRWAYFGFIEKHKKETKNRNLKVKAYLRKWNPRFQKRNKLYWWRRKLLFDFYRKNQIQKHKAQRIKQVLGKIYFPFYGNFNKKKFDILWKKKKKIKSQWLNKNENVLSFLENRLDVAVYRLNLAPNIWWARRLILEGSIFVNNIFSFSIWASIYGQLKHLSFPLKLRDPKNLYKLTFWDPNSQISKFKFLWKPTKKIHYLLKPGDLVQSAKSLSINKYKSNKRLFKKPIAKNFSIRTKTKLQWNNGVKAPEIYSAAKWREPKQQITSAMFLFPPRFSDFHKNGRIQELFFRWITL